MSIAKQLLERLIRLQESPTNLYVVDDLGKSKLQVRNELIALEKQGKEALKSSLFTKNLKFIQSFHDVIESNEDLYQKALIDDLDICGDVFLIDRSIFKQLGDVSYLYVHNGLIRGFIKFQKDQKVKLSNEKIAVASKSLIWKDLGGFSLSRAIELYFFNKEKLNQKYLLSDSFYTKEGKDALLRLGVNLLNKGYKVHLVEDNEATYTFKDSKDFEFQFYKYFGDSVKFSKYRFLFERP